MTDEEINAAIAEHCGWQHVTVNCRRGGRWLVGSLIGTSPDSETTQYVPNYSNDLNVMHEAEETLGGGWRDYVARLKLRPGPEWGFATARQRAEAFLRTVGKWKED